GKEKKVAVTAVMRKRLVLANAQLRDHRMLPCRAVGSTVLWPTAHKRLRPSCRWTKVQLSTRTTQVGLLSITFISSIVDDLNAGGGSTLEKSLMVANS
ncbi:hypothetical protein, partial [Parasedimentitalea psychrophila]